METRWLTEEESLAWRAVMSMMLRIPGPLDAQMQRDSGITLFDYLALSYLSMATDRTLRMSELAAVTNGSLSRLSNVVKRLEQRGWVVREPDPTDGRYTLAHLTDEGHAVVEAAAPGHVEAVRHYVIDPLTAAQQRTLTEVADRLQQQRAREGDTSPELAGPRPG
ncbi:MAG: MarR family transcriptional regulator [Lapillicoccus sp.]